MNYFTEECKSRIYEIIQESLNTAFVVCHSDSLIINNKQFTDVFDQILPTAFILNNGYWPFFNCTLSDCKICVCNRFLIPCKHDYSPSKQHCIGTDSLDKEQVPENATIKPMKYSIKVMESLPTLPCSYSITILIWAKMEVKLQRQPICKVARMQISERYQILKEHSPLNQDTYTFTTIVDLKDTFNKIMNDCNNFQFNDNLQRNDFMLKLQDIPKWTLCSASALPIRMMISKQNTRICFKFPKPKKNSRNQENIMFDECINRICKILTGKENSVE